MKSEPATAAAIKEDAVYSEGLAGMQRDGKPGLWCSTCETFMPPKHICEWKILATVVLGAGVVGVVFMCGMFIGMW